ncbi:hypothetical protein HOA92_06330 [archaeon]|jgi:hypothetical protein|nr:hypothetical protein [archaeon]MBT6762628.1 hypothetical protein [archaeon]
MSIDPEYIDHLKKIPIVVIPNDLDIGLYRFKEDRNCGLIDLRGRVSGIDRNPGMPSKEIQNQLLAYAAGQGIYGVVYDLRENENDLAALLEGANLNKNHGLDGMTKSFLGVDVAGQVLHVLINKIIDSVNGRDYFKDVNLNDLYHNFSPNCFENLVDAYNHVKYGNIVKLREAIGV